RRMFAQLLDLILCYGAVFVFGIFLLVAFAGAGALTGALDDALKLGVGLLLLLVFAAQWLYFVVWEALRGTTPGKMALGLRVLTTEGRPIGVTEAALRNLLRAADALPIGYLVGVASMTLSPRFQRLGDLVAGTIVVIPDRSRAAAPLTLWPPARPEEW